MCLWHLSPNIPQHPYSPCLKQEDEAALWVPSNIWHPGLSLVPKRHLWIPIPSSNLETSWHSISKASALGPVSCDWKERDRVRHSPGASFFPQRDLVLRVFGGWGDTQWYNRYELITMKGPPALTDLPPLPWSQPGHWAARSISAFTGSTRSTSWQLQTAGD